MVSPFEKLGEGDWLPPTPASAIDGFCPSGVYCLMKGPDVVYVGQSINMYARLVSHRKACTGDFDSFTWLPLPKEDLNNYEALWIVFFKPALNTHLPKNDRFMMFGRMRQVLWHELGGFILKPHHIAGIEPCFEDTSNKSTAGAEYWDIALVRAALSNQQEVA